MDHLKWDQVYHPTRSKLAMIASITRELPQGTFSTPMTHGDATFFFEQVKPVIRFGADSTVVISMIFFLLNAYMTPFVQEPP